MTRNELDLKTEMDKKCEIIEKKGSKEKKNTKNKVLICGLLSGIVTKTVFAPFDRIRLFYQIQPMFQQYHTQKKNTNKNRYGSLNIYKNINSKTQSQIKSQIKSQNQSHIKSQSQPLSQSLSQSQNQSQIQSKFQSPHCQSQFVTQSFTQSVTQSFTQSTSPFFSQNDPKKSTEFTKTTCLLQDVTCHETNKRQRIVFNRNIEFDKLKRVLTELKTQCTKTKETFRNSACLHFRNDRNHKIVKHFLNSYKIILNYTNMNNSTWICKMPCVSKNWKLYKNNNFKKILKNKRNYIYNHNNTNLSLKYRNIIQSFFYIIKEEGILGLWRGNLINIIRGGLVYSAKFGTNDLVKEKYRSEKEKDKDKDKNKSKNKEIINEFEINNIHNTKNANDTTDTTKKYSNRNTQINYRESIVAGYMSGMIQKTISYPLDLLSIRMALGVNEQYLRNNTYKKKSIFKLIHDITTKEGIFGFFKGFCPTLLTGVPYVTLQMFLFDFYKNAFQNTFPSPFSLSNTSLMYTALYSSISGSLSNLTALIVVFPGDTVRKRMMNNGIDNKNYLYKNSLDCIKYIYYKEGFKNFYFGLFPSVVKSIPSGAIQFLSYEILKHLLTQE